MTAANPSCNHYRSANGRRIKRLLPVVAALALCFGVMAGCFSRAAHDPRPPLYIGTLEHSPPFIFKQHGHWQGAEADLAVAFAARLGMKPVFRPLPADKLEATLLSGGVDLIMAGYAITDERREQFDFAAPYLTSGLTALMRNEYSPRYNTEIKIRAAAGRIGVLEHSDALFYVTHYFSHGTVIPFASPEEAAAALLENRIDLFVGDAPTLWWISKTHQDELSISPVLFGRREIAWAFRKGSSPLLEAADKALEQWRQDGTLETILHDWMPVGR